MIQLEKSRITNFLTKTGCCLFYVPWFLSKEKCDLTTKIDTKRTEVDHLKKELQTFKRLTFANVPIAPDKQRIEQKIKKLNEEIAKLAES